jgi:hypothetical protein
MKMNSVIDKHLGARKYIAALKLLCFSLVSNLKATHTFGRCIPLVTSLTLSYGDLLVVAVKNSAYMLGKTEALQQFQEAT